MSSTQLPLVDDGAVLAGVKATPSGWPPASPDPSSGRHPPAATGSGIQQIQVSTASGDCQLANPTALANMLRSHTIAEYVPRGGLATTPGGSFDRTFTNLKGETIKIGNDFAINGGTGGGASYWLANGTQIHPVDSVSFPPAS